MENLFYLFFLVPVVLANLADRDRRWRPAALGLVAAIDLGLLAMAGFAGLSWAVVRAAPGQMPPEFQAANWPAVAAILVLTGLAAWLPLVPEARRWLAGRLPLDPNSAVHATALAFAVYQVGASLAQGALIGAIENLAGPEYAVGISGVLLSGAWLTLLALLGVGLLTRRGAADVADRLGLERPTWRQALLAVGLLVLILAFSYGANLAWQALDPAGFDRIDRVTRNLFAGLTGVSGALLLGLSSGISEELLFRGAVQPRLGLVPTALLFAVGHLQYGLSPAAFEVLVIGLVLGLLRKRANTTVCIAVHALYNIVNVLIG